MSQGSQGSNLLSQETLDQLFLESSALAKKAGLDQSSQGFTDFRSVPLDVQYSESNVQENYEMTLESISLMKADFEGLANCTMNHSINHYNGGANLLPSVSAASPYPNMNGIAGQNGHSSSQVAAQDNQIQTQPLILSNVDWPGSFLFDIGFEKEVGLPTKSTPWTYSLQVKKLFVKMRVKVPIRMKLAVLPPQGYYIRAVVVYKQPEYYKEVVERCPNHVTKHKDGHCAPQHLMRCENASTIYETCPNTKRHYLKIPISSPQAGLDFFTEMFEFMCFSSCPGGLNRRPSIVIFTLENSFGQVCGRKVLNVRICACPGRDRINEENLESKRRNHSNGTAEPLTPPATDVLDTSSEDVKPTVEPDSPKSRPDQQSTSCEPSQPPKLTKKRSNPMVTTGVQMSGLSFNPYKKIKKESSDDNDIYTINVFRQSQVRGREKYEILLKIKESLDLMDMVPEAQLDAYRRSSLPCGLLCRTPQTSSQAIQNSQHSDSQKSNDSQEYSDGTPPSLQFSLPSSGSSSSTQSISLSQGSSQGGGEISAIRFTLKRTVSL